MIKLTYLVKRRPDLADDTFCERWRELHARLVAEYATALNARRYVMSRRLHTACNAAVAFSRKLPPSHYDGVIEIWWESLEDYQAGVGTADGLKIVDALVDAERHFIDFAHSQAFFSDETVVFEQADGVPHRANVKDSKVKLSDQTSHSPILN